MQHYALVPRGWPAGLNLRLAVLADLHAGEPYMPVSRVEEIVAAGNRLGADVIVVLGDYLAGHRFMTRRVGMAEITPALAQLKAPLAFLHPRQPRLVGRPGCAACAQGTIVAVRALREAAIPVLENDVVRLEDGQSVWLAGLGDQLAFVLGPRRFQGVDDLPGTSPRSVTTRPSSSSPTSRTSFRMCPSAWR